jgi:hypothetical protein
MKKNEFTERVLKAANPWPANSTAFLMMTCGGSAELINRTLLNSSEWTCKGMFDLHSQYLIWERTTVASTSFSVDYGDGEEQEEEQPALTETSAIELLKSLGYKIYKEL